MNETILIEDNDKTTWVSLAAMLQQEGYDVLIATDGKAAVDTLAAEDIDVMLLEVELPEVDVGIDVLRKARNDSPSVLVIILTNAAIFDAAIQAVKFRVHDYLLKPYNPQELLSSITDAIVRRNERTRKRQLLEQVENIVQQFRDTEGFTEIPKHYRQLVSLPDGMTVDFTWRIIWCGSDREKLTPTENKLLELFVTNWGRLIEHTELVLMLQGYEPPAFEVPEILRPLVSRLRKKLATLHGEKWITSVRGVGYVFDGGRMG